MENKKPDIAFAVDENGTYTLTIGKEKWHELTLDEVCAIINGKELED